MTRFTILGDDVPVTLVQQLAAYATMQHISIGSVDALHHVLPTLEVVVLAGRLALTVAHATLLLGFVGRGGGLVCTGPALDSCHDHPALMTLLGAPKGCRMPHTELIVRPLDHPLAQRWESGWALHDSLLQLSTPLLDAVPAFEVAWQMGRHPVVYTPSSETGCVAVITLGMTATAQADPRFADLLARTVLQVANARVKAPVNVALLGYGAIGREHADALMAVDGLQFHTICDRSVQRLEQAHTLYPEVQLRNDLTDLATDPSVDLVIVATPPNTHAAIAHELLEAGKHVVVEKPFCLTTAEADGLIALADRQHRMLTVYQNRRWDADFQAIKQVVQQRTIGDVFSIETFIGGYGHPCDYWHSDATISGGVFYDWGSHYLDWILTLMPADVVAVSASEHKRVWHGSTNADHSTIRLRFADGTEAEFVHSDIAAALKPKWYILGTQGAIVAQWRHETIKSRRWSGDLIEERLQAAEAPAIITVYQRGSGDVVHEQAYALPVVPAYPFHRNLADHLLLGAPLAVLPTSSRRNIAVMEAATRSGAEGAAWIAPQ